jgi:hypothetical protein
MAAPADEASPVTIAEALPLSEEGGGPAKRVRARKPAAGKATEAPEPPVEAVSESAQPPKKKAARKKGSKPGEEQAKSEE